MNKVIDFITGLDIEEGQSLRRDCPDCYSKNTLGITKEEGWLLYHCYKLRCNVKGSFRTGMTANEVKKKLATYSHINPWS